MYADRRIEIRIGGSQDGSHGTTGRQAGHKHIFPGISNSALTSWVSPAIIPASPPRRAWSCGRNQFQHDIGLADEG